MDNFSRSQIVRKAVIPTRGGVVAAAHRRAAEVGAAVLAAGGDAVDAAVAVSFAIGVVEPWMSGPAAGGAMVLWRADEGRARVVDYGMRSPMALDPADYPLTGGGLAKDLFAWPAVLDDRNVQGATAVAVPGVVVRHGAGPCGIRPSALAGSARARRGAGRRRLAGRLVFRAAHHLGGARAGGATPMPRACSWTTAPGRSAVPGPRSPTAISTSAPWRLRWTQIARHGPREFYDGEVAPRAGARPARQGRLA